ncbi:MAG: hypothetical protein V4691_10625 [Pseudomonadota bacterium]
MKRHLIFVGMFTFTVCTTTQHAIAANDRKPRPHRVHNDVETIITKPDLPAEINDPARARRNHDWLSGYGGYGNEQTDEDNQTEPQQRDRRRWQRRHRR